MQLSQSSAIHALALAMTDLFISAAAALLAVLAIAGRNPPVPLPVNADYVIICDDMKDAALVPVKDLEFEPGTSVWRIGARARVSQISDIEALRSSITALASPKLLLVIALIETDSDASMQGYCSTRVRRLVRQYMTDLDAGERTGGYEPALSLVSAWAKVEIGDER